MVIPLTEDGSFNYSQKCALANHANLDTNAPHLASRGAFWHRVGCTLTKAGCIYRGRDASSHIVLCAVNHLSLRRGFSNYKRKAIENVFFRVYNQLWSGKKNYRTQWSCTIRLYLGTPIIWPPTRSGRTSANLTGCFRNMRGSAIQRKSTACCGASGNK